MCFAYFVTFASSREEAHGGGAGGAVAQQGGNGKAQVALLQFGVVEPRGVECCLAHHVCDVRERAVVQLSGVARKREAGMRPLPKVEAQQGFHLCGVGHLHLDVRAEPSRAQDGTHLAREDHGEWSRFCLADARLNHFGGFVRARAASVDARS